MRRFNTQRISKNEKLAQKTREHEAALASVRAEAKVAAGDLARERHGALDRYHGLLHTYWKVVKVADESNAKYPDTLTKLCLQFEEGLKVVAPA